MESKIERVIDTVPLVDSQKKIEKFPLCVLVSLDTETTGLKVYEDQITELAAKSVLLFNDCSFEVLHSLDHVDVSDDSACVKDGKTSTTLITKKKEAFQRHVKCTKAIGLKSQRITGITEKTLLNAPLIATMFELFAQYIQNIWQNVNSDVALILVAHNGIKFDLPIIIAELERNNLNATKYMRQLKFSYLLDTVIMARDVVDTLNLPRDNTGKPCFKLGGIYQMLCKRELVGAHGAEADCSAVLELLLEHACFRDAFLQDWNGPKKYFKNIMNIVTDVVENIPKKMTTVSNENPQQKVKKLKTMLNFFKPLEKEN